MILLESFFEIAIYRPRAYEPINSLPGHLFWNVEHASCYLKEAKAMLQGKNWAGHNKCIKLVGD
jgi:hypothetical protein